MNSKALITRICLAAFFIGLSFSTFAEHAVITAKQIEWAKPKGFSLTADIYSPDTGKKSYPVLIIFHGGGWLINRNTIMNDMANYIASHSEILVVNMNYRLLGDNDNSTTMNEIVEDALGATLWVKDHIAEYRGNPKAIAVTGDSAGGHLAAMVLLNGRQLDSDGFGGPTLGFTPSYLPSKTSPEKSAQNDGIKVQAAVLSYPALDMLSSGKNGFETESNIFWKFAGVTPRGIFGKEVTADKNPDFYKMVSPMYLVPKHTEYKLPAQFVLVGSEDNVTPAASSQQYVDLLRANQQPIEFKIYEGKTHAFLDSGCSEYTKGCFNDLAPIALNDVIRFLNAHLTPAR